MKRILSKRVDIEINGTNGKEPHKYGTDIHRSMRRLDFSTNSTWTMGYTYEIGPPTSYCILKIYSSWIKT